jgi:predicted nucleic acid-binding protein
MYVALDTNILVYAEGVHGKPREARARAIVDRLAPESTLLPAQALGELYAVLVRKAGRSREQARDAVLKWGDAFPIIETSSPVLLQAMELSARHHLAFWDAIILSAAADANCRLLLSEDFQDGFTWSGVTIADPFAAAPHPLLEVLLSSNIS